MMHKEMVWKRKNRENRLEIRENKGVPFLVFPDLEQDGLVMNAFSTRLGGVSTGDCASMNVSFSRGDREEDVRENYRRFGGAAGFSCENLVCTHQTHTTNVRLVTEADRGKGFTRPQDYEQVDGLITNVPGLVLAAFYADCVPLYFVDPVNRAIGLSHSGWRGTAGKIGAKTLQAMKEAYGTRPEQVYAAIGPSICQDCYEVSRDVAEIFWDMLPEAEQKKAVQEKADGKYQLDLWAVNAWILKEAGVREEHLTVTDICTCCNPGLLFSHRASGGRRGNLGAFLMLREHRNEE